MTLTQIRELRQARKALFDQARALTEKARAEKRDMMAEEQNQFDAVMADVDKRGKEIEREERLLAIETGGSIQGPGSRAAAGEGEDNGSEAEKRYGDTFKRFLRFGVDRIGDEDRAVMAAHVEHRDIGVGAGNTGGYTVPKEFFNRLEVALKYFGGMMDSAEIIRTGTGGQLPMPSLNDTAATGELLGEGVAAANDAATPFGVVNLDAYKYSSKLLAVSIEYLQDSAFDEQVLINMLGERLGRIINTHCTTGDGAAKPNGIVTAATLGKTGAGGQVTSIIYDDLVDLIYSVDVAYRKQGRCKWMTNDVNLKAIRKLKDSQNRPLWEPSLQVGQPDVLLGFPVVINNDVAAMAASAKSLLFGDFTRYKIRIVLDMQLLRLTERLAEKGQVGFIGFMRADGDLLDAGTNPVKFYANPAA